MPSDLFFFLVVMETGSHLAQAGLKLFITEDNLRLLIPLLLPSES